MYYFLSYCSDCGQWNTCNTLVVCYNILFCIIAAKGLGHTERGWSYGAGLVIWSGAGHMERGLVIWGRAGPDDS
jgi:hypothetical protein